ncbi:O-antigen ligase [Undibacterium sp.]|uniref:O-antigen ligase family protein n=1 Tax=Undibacterium sp. TaxID=1914977 RepID=UPI0025FCD4D9|nr:O-antigen ligase family protein [Undibacterium sp.]
MNNPLKMANFTFPVINFGKLALFGLWFFLAIFFGLASAVLPPKFLLMFGSIPLAILMAGLFPALAFSAVLVIAFGLLPQFLFGSLSLGGASLQPAELLILLIFSILIFRGEGLWRSALLPAKSLILPFCLLAAGVALGFFQGKILAHYKYAGADFRQYVGWLALPVALWLNRRYPGIVRRIVLYIALGAACAMVFQMVSGIQIIYGFRGSEGLTKEFNDVKRSAIGGGELFLVYSAYYLFAHFCDSDSFRKTALFGLILVLGALVASFSRGVWASALLGALVFLLISPKFKRSKSLYTLIALVSATVFGLGLSVAVPRVGEAMVDRVLSIAQEGKKGSSVGFRLYENQQAWKSIQESPILGKGVGAEYKAVFRQVELGGGFDTEKSYVHNAYLGIWLKLGIFGFIFPFFLTFLLFRSVFSRRKTDHQLELQLRTARLSSCAAFSSLIGVAVYGLTSPVWSTFSAIAVSSCLIVLICDDGRYAPRKA